MRYLVALLLLAAPAFAQTVVIIPSNGSNDKGAQMAESWNWNIRRQAAIQDALTYERLRPPESFEVIVRDSRTLPRLESQPLLVPGQQERHQSPSLFLQPQDSRLRN